MVNNVFLELAIAESRLSVEKGSSPFGAVIIKNNEVIACAHNSVVFDNDPTAHAEINAIRQACNKLNTFDLSECILYSSCEPCPMCLGAIKWANIRYVYYAASQQDADMIGFRDKKMYDGVLPIKLIHIDTSEAIQVMREWCNNENKKYY